MPTNISSDVRRLRKVLLHRPGKELLNLVPKYLTNQLFDDIPWYEKAIEEHNFFAEILRSKGVEVRYLKDMLCECIADRGLREELTERFLSEALVAKPNELVKLTHEYLSTLTSGELVDVMIGGLRTDEVDFGKNENDYPFILDPMPNALFSRDPFSFVGNGVVVSKMFMPARQRETLFGDFLLTHHGEFKGIKKYYSREFSHSIEGGDVMMLSKNTLAVGVSERTSFLAVRKLVDMLKGEIEKVLAVIIPNERRFMHLDTIMTMVDNSKFVVYREAVDAAESVLFECSESGVTERALNLPIKDALKEATGESNIDFIYCGGESGVDSAREQWSDGANTLAIAPGEVIVYNRNPVTNKLFAENGIIAHEMPCSELSRGRGGPHCMSMPFLRD